MKKETYFNLKKFLPHLAIFVFLIIYATILSYKVISRPTPFFDWDESIYVQVGKEMIQSKSLVPLWQGSPWFEKPPLAPLFYGAITQFVPISPEISTRVASVLLSIVALALLYLLILRAQKSWLFATFVTIATAANPIILHRAQIVNTDVFLLIGWLGYFLFFRNFRLSFFFLSIGVLSKSLLGFYPVFLVFIFEVYEFIVSRNKKLFLQRVKEMVIQVAVLSLWYVLMTIFFGAQFIKVHFQDHLISRVTKSIEAHFGQRTYYIDIITHQYGNFSLIALAGVVILLIQFYKKSISALQLLLSLALLPWFLFLNLTKTKLDWYIYPALPQIVFLISYPILLLKRYKIIFYTAMVVLLIVFLSGNYEFKSVFTTNYSTDTNTYHLGLVVKKNCTDLNILVDPKSRNDNKVLETAGLLISTSDIYGVNPSLMYYTEKKVTPFYDEQPFLTARNMSKPNSCWVVEEGDKDLKFDSKEFKKVGTFGVHYLYKRV